MKHLLNNLSEEEKNSIRGQHTGGMQVNNSRFNTLLENKLGNSKPLVEQLDDEDDYDDFESPFCKSCEGTGCEECDGSGMKRNSIFPDSEENELEEEAPERRVKDMDSGKITGTHKYGVGYTPNEFGKSLGHSSHPTSIPNYTKMEDLDDINGMLKMSNPNKGRRYRDLEEDTSWMNELEEGYEDDYTASGLDSMGDAAHSALKSKGHSHRGKDDEGEFYIVFDGEKFYQDDFEIAHHNDTGKIPRVEDGKLIIANPAWGA
jgi:hypothetical protein